MKTLGKYEVLEELGAGAMGKVFHGRDRVLQREVAIKTISTEDADVELKQRFYREARSCGRLSHPNIVTVFDLGEQQGTSYIAMEYLEGEDLRKFIDRKSFMPLEGKLQIMSEVADGLAHAHDNRIVHRDIKPSNIFLLKSGRPKLLDFGIARVFASQLTRVGNALGTPEYMAPEQIRGKETDARSDIFSAAVVFFELLTHEHPFGDTDIPRKIIQDPPKSLRALNPLIPEKLEQILLKAMSKDPADRYQTAPEFAKALRKLSFEILANCSKFVDESLANRQRILDSLAAISKSGQVSWIQQKLKNDNIDTNVVNKITPEMAASTNANLHYFSLSALSQEMGRTAEAVSRIAEEHRGICRDIEQARKLLADGNAAEASRLLNAHQGRKSDYPEIESLQRDIQNRDVEKIEAVQKEREREKPRSGDPGTIAVSKPKGNPELDAVRRRIALLLDEDIDKCLAEIEILPPGLANDSVIDSYWVRALSKRSAQQAVSAAEKSQTPPPVSPAVHAQTQPRQPTPAFVPVAPPPEDKPTVVNAGPEPAAQAQQKAELKSFFEKPGNIKLVGGGAAAAVILIAILIYSFSGHNAPPQPANSGPDTVKPNAQPAQPPAAAVQETAPQSEPKVSDTPQQRETPARDAAKETKKNTKPAAIVAAPPSSQKGTGQRIVPTPQAPAPPDWSQDLAAARQAFSQEKYDTAIELCVKILAAEPTNKQAQELRQAASRAKEIEQKSRGQ